MKRKLVAGIVIRDGMVLLVHNTKHGSMRVEPPGGKVHPGEDPEDSLRREMLEEVGVNVTRMELLGSYDTDSPEGPFTVMTYLCNDTEGEPVLKEPEKITGLGWYSYAALKRLEEERVLVPNVSSALDVIRGLLEG